MISLVVIRLIVTCPRHEDIYIYQTNVSECFHMDGRNGAFCFISFHYNFIFFLNFFFQHKIGPEIHADVGFIYLYIHVVDCFLEN